MSKPSQCGALEMCIMVPFVRIFNYYIIRTSPDVRISGKSRLKCPLEMQILKRLRQFFLVAALKHGQTLHHLPASVFIPTRPPSNQHTHTQILTSGHWHFPSWSTVAQTVGYQRAGEARGSPRTSPPPTGASEGRASKRKQDERRWPFPVPGGWAGSGCPTKRSAASGWEWVPCCSGSNTAGRSKRGPRGWPGAPGRPAGRACCTVAGPAA